MKKICNKCKTEKLFSDFSKDNSVRSGLRTICKKCDVDRVMAARANNLALWEHEQVHLRQIERDGAFMWTIKVFWYLLIYGYDNSPYELEAKQQAGI